MVINFFKTPNCVDELKYEMNVNYVYFAGEGSGAESLNREIKNEVDTSSTLSSVQNFLEHFNLSSEERGRLTRYQADLSSMLITPKYLNKINNDLQQISTRLVLDEGYRLRLDLRSRLQPIQAINQVGTVDTQGLKTNEGITLDTDLSTYSAKVRDTVTSRLIIRNANGTEVQGAPRYTRGNEVKLIGKPIILNVMIGGERKNLLYGQIEGSAGHYLALDGLELMPKMIFELADLSESVYQQARDIHALFADQIPPELMFFFKHPDNIMTDELSSIVELLNTFENNVDQSTLSDLHNRLTGLIASLEGSILSTEEAPLVANTEMVFELADLPDSVYQQTREIYTLFADQIPSELMFFFKHPDNIMTDELSSIVEQLETFENESTDQFLKILLFVLREDLRDIITQDNNLELFT